MKILLVNTQRDFRNEEICTVSNIETGIEKLYIEEFDAVIFSNQTTEEEERKFRAVLQRQNYRLIVLRQDTEELEMTITQTREILRTLRLQQIVFNDTLNVANLADAIQIA